MPVPARPNVLIFCVDEMRADHLGGRGANAVVRTPHLDALAAGGTTFRRAYCNNPICMPARATMFTGLLPRDHGLRTNGQSLRRDQPLLPALLAAAGYRTHAAGKLHLTPWVPACEPPQPDIYPECLDYWQRGLLDRLPTPYYGFQTVDYVGGHGNYVYGNYPAWLRARGGDPALLQPKAALSPACTAPTCYRMALPEELHYNRYIADSAISTIQARSDAPFFVWCSFPDPHLPVAPPRPYCDLYDPAAVALPARRAGEVADLSSVYARVVSGELRPNGCDNRPLPDAQWRELIALTYGMITHVDTEIGRVLAALAASGQAEHTLVIFTSDHGDMMGDHGLIWKAFYTFQGCVRLPLIVRPPGGGPGGTSDALVCQLDLLPTVLDACGLPLPGADWAARPTPFERGSVQPLGPWPGRSYLPLARGQPGAIRPAVVIENDDPCAGFRVRALVTDRYRLTVYPGLPDGELFDLRADPAELHNLWQRPDYARVRADLIQELLSRYSLETPWYPIPPWNA